MQFGLLSGHNLHGLGFGTIAFCLDSGHRAFEIVSITGQGTITGIVGAGGLDRGQHIRFRLVYGDQFRVFGDANTRPDGLVLLRVEASIDDSLKFPDRFFSKMKRYKPHDTLSLAALRWEMPDAGGVAQRLSNAPWDVGGQLVGYHAAGCVEGILEGSGAISQTRINRLLTDENSAIGHILTDLLYRYVPVPGHGIDEKTVSFVKLGLDDLPIGIVAHGFVLPGCNDGSFQAQIRVILRPVVVHVRACQYCQLGPYDPR